MQCTVVAQLTLALLPPGPHLFWLCFFAVLGVTVVTTVRVTTDLGTGIVTGMPACHRVHPCPRAPYLQRRLSVHACMLRC